MSQSQLQPPLTPSYLRSLPSIRQRSSLVYSLAAQGKLDHFTLHEDKLDTVVDYCIRIIKRDYGEDYGKIPGHSRWRHFVTPQRGDLLGGVIEGWEGEKVGKREVARRLVDLFVVSVLLDAGAGPTWKYLYEPTGEYIGRSEGLAVASLDMFLSGAFSSSSSASSTSSSNSTSNSNGANKDKELRVDSIALKNLTTQTIRSGLQGETMTGLEGRAGLLIRLGEALEARPEVFKDPQGVFRPGNMVDWLYPDSTNETQTSTSTSTETPTGSAAKIQVGKLWEVVMDGFGPIWPSSERTSLNGVSLGDAWKCAVLAEQEPEVGGAAGIVPFHKLSQWMTYSLMEPLQKILGVEIEGVEQMTGLPEYRNGGLLLDLGFLVLKNNKFGEWHRSAKYDTPPSTPSERWTPRETVDSQTVIEWRALTVIALDKIAQRIREKLNAPDLSTAQVLEAATWKAGREVAKELREGGGPPIEIVSDGTVF